MAQTIWIARHGNRQDFVDLNWHGKAEMPFDPGLSPDGVQQAQELAQRLTGEGIRHIFASPFLRTVETAHYVAEALDLPIKLESGFGEWLNLAQIWYVRVKRFPRFRVVPKIHTIELLQEYFPRIDPSYVSCVMPRYRETGRELESRVSKTLEYLTADFSEDLLIVSHGAPIRQMTKSLVGSANKVRCSLCCLVKLVNQNGKWKMELKGDVSHLSSSEKSIRFY